MKWLVVSGLVALMLFGCFARVIESSYYQLDYVPTPKEMLNSAAYPYTIRVKDFDVAEAYRRNNIVYRQSPYQLHYYNYELWAVKPEYLISDVLFRHLEAAKMFVEVRRSIDVEEPDFTISGTIRALEEYDNQDEWYAHLAINMNLQDNRTKRIVWSREWDYRKKVSNLEPIYVVRGLSELLELINNEAISDIDAVMASILGKPREPAPVEMEVLPPPGEIE
ncbi:MAG: PqiC family protein [Fibromonadales bacterium]|nr:PqiC family protein [Fibromonadales bacterium]